MKCYKNIYVDFYCKFSGSYYYLTVFCDFLLPEAKTFSLVIDDSLNFSLILKDSQGVFAEYSEPEEYGIYMNPESFKCLAVNLWLCGFVLPEGLPDCLTCDNISLS